MNAFHRDTAVIRTGDGTYRADVTEAWWIVRGPNGGYLAAILLRAMTDAIGDPERAPRSLTIHFTRPPAAGPVEIHTTIERAGRSVSTVSARMVQDAKLIAIALGALSRPWTGPDFTEAPVPDAPAPEDIEAREDRIDLPFMRNFDFRWAVGVAPLGSGGPARSGAWMRLRGGGVLDATLGAQLMDAWTPAVFSKIVPRSGVPTIDLTIHFREVLPPPGATADDWYLGVFETRTSKDGLIEEDGELWSRDGRLLAQSRQLAVLMTTSG